MIAGVFHQGSGLGNQLHRYVATRVLALDKGYDFTMLNPSYFKGKDFMNLLKQTREDLDVDELWYHKYFEEKKVTENGVDIRGYDPEFNFIEDNTTIDGEFQDERYFGHRMKEINEWLSVEPIEIPDDVCVIGFRGGEFTVFPDLYLNKEYWNEAIQMLCSKNPLMKFEVHTDDPTTAQQVFPQFKVIHDIGINWRSVRCAKYAIIANSSFYILPRLLAHESIVGLVPADKYPGTTYIKNAVTIAPRYWARHNTKVWSMPQNYYSKFMYI